MLHGDSASPEYHKVREWKGRANKLQERGVRIVPQLKDICRKTSQDFKFTETNLSGELADREGLKEEK